MCIIGGFGIFVIGMFRMLIINIYVSICIFKVLYSVILIIVWEFVILKVSFRNVWVCWLVSLELNIVK